MAVDRARPEEAVARVDIDVVARAREELPRPRDLVVVFRHVGLQPAGRMLAPQCAGRVELRWRRRGGEARRDRVAQAPAPVPARDQRLRFVVAAPRGVAQRARRVAVHQHLAGDHPRAQSRRLVHEGVDRAGMHGAEHGRGRDALAQVLGEVVARDAAREPAVGEARTLPERCSGRASRAVARRSCRSPGAADSARARRRNRERSTCPAAGARPSCPAAAGDAPRSRALRGGCGRRPSRRWRRARGASRAPRRRRRDRRASRASRRGARRSARPPVEGQSTGTGARSSRREHTRGHDPGRALCLKMTVRRSRCGADPESP